MSTHLKCLFQIVLFWIAASRIEANTNGRCPRITTFNAAMLQVDGRKYADRVTVGINAINNNDADVLCLQELWLESDMQQLLDTVAHKYPYHYSQIHYRNGDLRKPLAEMNWRNRLKFHWSTFSPCSKADIRHVKSKILTCAVLNGCFNAGGAYQIVKCVGQKCASQMRSVSDGCKTCVGVMSGGGIQGVVEGCFPDPRERRNAFNGPGIMLLSKLPVTSVSYTDFFPGKSLLARRGYIEADIAGVGKVVCTHLTAIFSIYTEYDLTFPSFEAQHAEEIRLLIQKFNTTDHLLLGDLNTGPADPTKNVMGEFPANFQKLMGAGYTAPYLTQDGRCTYCLDNRLDNDTSYGDLLLDHILVMGDRVQLVDAKRTLDTTVPAPYSDHKGVEAQVCQASQQTAG